MFKREQRAHVQVLQVLLHPCFIIIIITLISNNKHDYLVKCVLFTYKKLANQGDFLKHETAIARGSSVKRDWGLNGPPEVQ